jgi:hypothetical protein
LDVSPVDGARIEDLITELYRIPRDVVEAARMDAELRGQ